MTTTMTAEQWRRFLSEGSRTGILSTVRKDGRPHAAPVWFVLDGEVVVFNTGRNSIKGRTLRRTGQAALTVDDARAPFSYVSITGHVEISEDVEAMRPWSVALAERYMGAERAEEYGRRNAVPGELLVRLYPDDVVAFAGVAD